MLKFFSSFFGFPLARRNPEEEGRVFYFPPRMAGIVQMGQSEVHQELFLFVGCLVGMFTRGFCSSSQLLLVLV